MPATLEINREEVRMLVLEVGCREAARRLGMNENTVMAWCRRFSWLEGRPANIPLPPSVIQPARNARTPAEAMMDAWRDDMVQTRLGGSRIVRKQITELEQRSGAELVADGGGTVLTVLKGAALVHDWSNQGTQKVTVCIQAGLGAAELPLPGAAQDIELSDGDAEVTACDPMDDPMFN